VTTQIVENAIFDPDISGPENSNPPKFTSLY